MRNGGDRRGNVYDRHARKHWLLATFGDGIHAPCTHCCKPLTYDTVTSDRIVPGGSYRRDNIQPSCLSCNSQRGDGNNWSPSLRYC